ncbi:MAG: hypothetical protein PHD81_03700 [Candidatus Nanoarchaeia archaeon]|nr:hypothetical protein [Candidatus Nanoarchaeia archaeon]MDD5588187.1 hypothetical protein [Candidatus Nanoarchaeia archaeon]
MQHLIGVYHVNKNLDSLIKYINNKFGIPKTLMLELPPFWKEVKEGFLAKNNKYFEEIAKEFERKGSRIIAGDASFEIIFPRKLYDEYDNIFTTNPDNLSDKLKLIGQGTITILKAIKKVELNLRNKRLCEIRDIGFLNTFLSEKPELTVVGDAHAQYIASKIPNLDYTLFKSNTFLENIDYYLSKQKIKPSKKIVIKI